MLLISCYGFCGECAGRRAQCTHPKRVESWRALDSPALMVLRLGDVRRGEKMRRSAAPYSAAMRWCTPDDDALSSGARPRCVRLR
eukprot:2740307-Pleurochrysis_carterae.AAC.2